MFTYVVLLFIFGIAVAEENQATSGNSLGEADDNDETGMKGLIVSFDRTFGGSPDLSRKMYMEGLSPVSALQIQEKFLKELHDQTAAYEFVQAKGIDKVITPLMNTVDIHFVENGVQIIKKLFELIPTTVKSVMPYSFLDIILDKFDANESPKLNRHAVDVMTLWLLKNPGAQTHVMRIKGLEPFYSQIPHLDSDVVAKLLSLFKELILEHVKIIKETKPITKAEKATQNMYKKLAFLEVISSEKTCLGLVMLYEEQAPERDKLIGHIMDLLKITKPFCLDNYKRKRHVMEFLTDIEDYLSDESQVDHFATLGLNPTEVKRFVQKYKRDLTEDEL